MSQTKVRNVVEKLLQEYPYHMAMDWDNPGLQVGRMEGSAGKIVVALDATDEVIEECVRFGADLLITHHPLLMSGVRQINDGSMAGRRILTLAENRIAHYAIHTNYDTAVMGELAADRIKLADRKILEVTGGTDDSPYGIGVIGNLDSPMTAEEVCKLVKEAFGLNSIRLFGNPEKKVQYIAISPGSGKSMAEPAISAGVELLVTGDIGHHDGLDAVDQGLLVADAGHYGIEHIFIDHMCKWLRGVFPELEVKAVQENPPFISL